MRKRGSASIGSYVPFLLFVVCLGAVAIFSGYYLGKYLVSSFSSLKPAIKDKPAAQQQTDRPAPVLTLNVQGMKLWRVQAGAFNVKANADGVVAKLKKAGIPAILTGDTQYRVLVAYLPSEEAAAKVVQSLKAKGFEAAMWKHEFEGCTLRLQGEQEYSEAVKAAFEGSWSALDKSLKAVDAYILGRQADSQAIVEAAASVSALKQRLATAKPASAVEVIHKGAADVLEAASSAVQSLSVAASASQASPAALGDVANAVLQYEKTILSLSKR